MSVEKRSEGSSGSDEGTPFHHVSIKPLPYMETAVTGWFAVMDVRFHIANVKYESTSVFRYPAVYPLTSNQGQRTRNAVCFEILVTYLHFAQACRHLWKNSPLGLQACSSSLLCDLTCLFRHTTTSTIHTVTITVEVIMI